jgi:hypothetical protein
MRSPPVALIVAVVLSSLAAVAAAAAVRIRIEAPVVDPATPKTREAVAELLEMTAAMSARLHGASIELVSDPQSSAAYALAITAALGGDSPAIVVTLKRLSDGGSRRRTLARPGETRAADALARAVFLHGAASPAWPPRPPPSRPRSCELPSALIQQYAIGPWRRATTV